MPLAGATRKPALGAHAGDDAAATVGLESLIQGLDRGEDLVGDGVGREQEIYALGTRKLDEGAAADPQVLLQAEANAKATLTGLLKGLGFESVTIKFEGPDPPST